MKTRARNLFPIWIVLLAWPVFAHAQEAQHPARTDKAVGYGFVSPNTAEGLKLEDALRKLNSAEETRLALETRELACQLRVKIRASKALGNWKDGSENSMIFRVYSDEATVRYAAATLGKREKQKLVLYFYKSPGGKGRMYIIALRRRRPALGFVSNALERSGISYRTLLPVRNGLLIYVVDLNNELRPKARAAARRLLARVTTLAGNTAFVGDEDDRDRAQAIFDREEQGYLANHAALKRGCSPGKSK